MARKIVLVVHMTVLAVHTMVLVVDHTTEAGDHILVLICQNVALLVLGMIHGYGRCADGDDDVHGVHGVEELVVVVHIRLELLVVHISILAHHILDEVVAAVAEYRVVAEDILLQLVGHI